jgi:dipeptidase
MTFVHMGCELTHPTDPTTAAAARLMDVAFFASVLRDFYNGTKYDMAGIGNLAAGPWGDPDRYGTWDSTVKGSWERSIGVYSTAYAHITQVHFPPQRSQSRLRLVVVDPAFFGSVR